MNRNIILFLVLILTAGAAYYVWKTRKPADTNMERADSNFKIEDIGVIDRIVIATKDGSRSDLQRDGQRWIINGQHRVRQSSMDHLLTGIRTQHLEHIPTPQASVNILKSMAVNGIHVEIFNKAGELLLDYYVGGVTQDERGTFFLKEGSTQPYSLMQPGFEGSLRARYALRPVDWRDVRFWVEDTERIDTISVNYPRDKQHSFRIIKEKNDYRVEPLFATTPRRENFNEVRINSYITSLSGLACENFLSDSPEKDSILRMVPFLEIDMAYPDKSSYLRFYPAVHSAEASKSSDIPRFFIDYAGKDFMIAQQEVIKGAFRSYDYFFEQ